MIISHQEMVELKKSLLSQMNQYILNLGDEDILDIWFMNGLPDCPTEEDYLFFIEDEEEWKDICTLFGKLIKRADS